MTSRQLNQVNNKTYSKECCHPENPRFQLNKKRAFKNCDILTLLLSHDGDECDDDDFATKSKYHNF